MEYKRLSRCGIDNCKQTQFYIENGRWFCKNGHMREVWDCYRYFASDPHGEENNEKKLISGLRKYVGRGGDGSRR